MELPYAVRGDGKVEIKDSFLGVGSSVSIRHLGRDVEHALQHRVLEGKGEVQVENINFGVYLWYLKHMTG